MIRASIRSAPLRMSSASVASQIRSTRIMTAVPTATPRTHGQHGPFDRQLLGIAPDPDADVAAGFGVATGLGRYIDREEGGLPWPGRLLHVGSNTRCWITGGIKRPDLFKPAPQGRHRDAVLLGHGSEHNTRLAALLDEPGLEGRAVATAPVAWVEIDFGIVSSRLMIGAPHGRLRRILPA